MSEDLELPCLVLVVTELAEVPTVGAGLGVSVCDDPLTSRAIVVDVVDR